jgi:hypothetical protein
MPESVSTAESDGKLMAGLQMRQPSPMAGQAGFDAFVRGGCGDDANVILTSGECARAARIMIW